MYSYCYSSRRFVEGSSNMKTYLRATCILQHACSLRPLLVSECLAFDAAGSCTNYGALIIVITNFFCPAGVRKSKQAPRSTSLQER